MFAFLFDYLAIQEFTFKKKVFEDSNEVGKIPIFYFLLFPSLLVPLSGDKGQCKANGMWNYPDLGSNPCSPTNSMALSNLLSLSDLHFLYLWSGCGSTDLTRLKQAEPLPNAWYIIDTQPGLDCSISQTHLKCQFKTDLSKV